jgi:hypothetical protein
MTSVERRLVKVGRQKGEQAEEDSLGEDWVNRYMY